MIAQLYVDVSDAVPATVKLVPAVIVVTFGIAPTVPPTVLRLISTIIVVAAAVVVIFTFVVPLHTNVPAVDAPLCRLHVIPVRCRRRNKAVRQTSVFMKTSHLLPRRLVRSILFSFP